MKTFPIKRLTSAEIQAQRNKNLHYNCNEHYMLTHKHVNKQFYTLIDEENEFDIALLVEQAHFFVTLGNHHQAWLYPYKLFSVLKTLELYNSQDESEVESLVFWVIAAVHRTSWTRKQSSAWIVLYNSQHLFGNCCQWRTFMQSFIHSSIHLANAGYPLYCSNKNSFS